MTAGKEGGKYSEEVYAVTIIRDVASGVAVIEEWTKDGKPHRVDGPAFISRNAVTGGVTKEAWVRNNKHHREDGPAVIARKADTGRIIRSEWYLNGEKVSPPKPSRPRPKGHSRPRAGRPDEPGK
jgi:hypothetical protein